MTLHRILSSLITYCQNQYHDPLTHKTFDLAYILPNLIVCSGPVQDQLRRRFRPNRIEEMIKFLDMKHGRSNWKFFNLRSERYGYDPSDLNVAYFPFSDHEAPTFQLIWDTVKALDDWLMADPGHVSVLHCKAGKGRSGTICCCYLMYKDKLMTPNSANEQFSQKRFNESFTTFGVSILSQRRYINYFYHYLNHELLRSKIDEILKTGQVYTKIQTILLHNAIDSSVSVQLMKYSTKDLEICGTLVGEDDKTVKLTSELIIPITDIRISFHHNFIDNNLLQIPSSFSYFWMNSLLELYGHRYLNQGQISRVISDDNMCVLQAKKSLTWDELDGFKGTYQRGLKLFDSVDIIYEVRYQLPAGDNYISTCDAELPPHGSHLKRLFSHHRRNTVIV